MSLSWTHESPPRWDADKARIVGGAPEGIFKNRSFTEHQLLPGEWWRVSDADGEVLGYGWMDIVWGDGEILLAVAPEAQNSGVGAWILDRLTEEASARGLRYIYNTVRPTHPARDEVTGWLSGRGFVADSAKERLEKLVT
jgi:ribosomal protein S18 acetylase RimI-like enzyme